MTPQHASTARPRLLARLGLDRPELRAWAMYDFAESPFWSTVLTAIFPRFFGDYAAAGLSATAATATFAWWTTLTSIVVAVLAPIVGALADFRAIKKPMLVVFMTIGVVATALLATIERGGWVYAAIVFLVANVGVTTARVFYDSLLPHIASADEVDRVSTAGYAIGFVGGGVLLLINLAWVLSPATFGLADTVAAIKLSFVSVAIWWLVFSIPLLRGVAEPPVVLAAGERRDENPLRAALSRVWTTFHELRAYRNGFLLLLAFLLYSDGIQTMIRMSSIYVGEVGIDQNAQIAAFVLVQFVGIPCSFLFGTIAGIIGPKRALYGGLVVYTGCSVLGYFMSASWHFFALAAMIGAVQGGTQAISRSLFARMIPRHKSSEFFGFFSICEKFAAIFGPALFAVSVMLFQSSRAAVLSVIVFFVVGGLLLTRVDVAAGEAEARAAALD